MKYVEASQFGGPEVLRVLEKETPRATDGTLLVEVKAAGINYADVAARSGFYPAITTNIASGLARVSLPGFAAYGAAKGAVEVLTRYLAKELAQRRIAANVVAPGGLETDFGAAPCETFLKSTNSSPLKLLSGGPDSLTMWGRSSQPCFPRAIAG